MTWTDIFILLLWLYFCHQTVAEVSCYDSHSCASSAIDATYSGEYISCFGYKSCFNSPIIENAVGGNIDCQASHACYNSTLIQTDNDDPLISCMGLRSCANVKNISMLYGGQIQCRGEQSCINTRMFTSNISISDVENSIKCLGQLSCANATIISSSIDSYIEIRGYLAAYNATFISINNTTYLFDGLNSAFGAVVECKEGATCTVYCYGNSCSDLELIGDGTFDMARCWSAQKSDMCPNGYNMSSYSLIRDIDLVAINDFVLSELKREEDDDDDMNMDYDYSNGINVSLSDVTLTCDDYYECMDYSGIEIQNLNKSEYIELVYNDDHTDYEYAKSLVKIACRGYESCFFTDIQFDLNFSDFIDTTNTNTTTAVLLKCDGGRACINIPNFVFVNFSNSSNSIPPPNTDIGSTLNSTLNFDMRFGGGNWQTLSNVFDINVNMHDQYQLIDLPIKYQVFCTAYYGCTGISIYAAENVYCNARYSCRAASIINTHDSIWIYGSAALEDGIITNVTNDIHLLTIDACDSCIITNVYGNIYVLAPWALDSATITNVYGSIFALATASAQGYAHISNVHNTIYAAETNALWRVNVTNAAKIYCTYIWACPGITFKSVRLIVETAQKAISGTIISDMANYTMEYSNSDDDKLSIRTMTVKLYAATYNELRIFCSVGDTCKIGCFHENGCYNVYLNCYGTCLVDCDNGETYKCPYVEDGNSYSIWYSNETISITTTDTEEEEEEISDDNQSDEDEKLYQFFVETFSTMLIYVIIGIIVIICIWQCVKERCSTMYMIMDNNGHVNYKSDHDASIVLRNQQSLDWSNDENEMGSELRSRVASSSDIVVIDNEKETTGGDENTHTTNRNNINRRLEVFIRWCTIVQGFCRFNIHKREDRINLLKMYFCNADFFVFLIVFGICIFLGFVCILYGFGQITQLVLSNYWCESKTLDEIYQHSIEYGLNEGTNEGCWKSKQFTV